MHMIRENFDKYYKSASLYREREIDDSEPDIGLVDVNEHIVRRETESKEDDEDFFGEDSDEDAGFMSGDDFIEIE